MDPAVYWLWLQQAFGYGAQLAEVIGTFGSAKAFYDADEATYRSSAAFGRNPGFSASRLRRFLHKDLSAAKAILESCYDNEISVITPEDERYPAQLLQIPDYPAVLFVRGDLDCLNNKTAVAMIGARSPTRYAFHATQQIAGDLSENDFLIVSGGALGIDAAAHTGALRRKQKTVLVMGCGFFSGYLQENQQLREAVAQHGALVTEYPPTMNPNAGSFPLRNRLISALSDAVVIMEAAKQSGTLNTARHAKQQGKPIFVLPGDTDSPAFSGTRALLREGAKPIFSASDVAFYLGIPMRENQPSAADNAQPIFSGIDEPEMLLSRTKSGKKTSAQKKRTRTPVPSETTTAPVLEPSAPKAAKPLLPDGVSESAALVYHILSDGCTLFDEIVLQSSLPVPAVLCALTELELFGAVQKGEGNSYQLCD